MRLGIFGGTFDPPHLGHLILAEHAAAELALDRVIFTPASVSPFKREASSLPAELRCELVSLAIVGNQRFVCDDAEARRGDVSYSVETVREVAARHPQEQLFVLMGADSFADFPRWKDPGEIVRLAKIGVALRPGIRLDLAKHPFGEYAQVFPMPLLDISSSDIRRRIREGKSVRYILPWTVQTFIEANGLYRSG